MLFRSGDAVERAQVEDAFVRDEAVAAVERGEMFFEPLGNVIRIEDGELYRVHGKLQYAFGSTNLNARNRSQENKIPCSANESKFNRESNRRREMTVFCSSK